MKKTNIVVFVKGGVVQGIDADNDNVNVFVADFDNAEIDEDGKIASFVGKYSVAVHDDLHKFYSGKPDEIELACETELKYLGL